MPAIPTQPSATPTPIPAFAPSLNPPLLLDALDAAPVLSAPSAVVAAPVLCPVGFPAVADAEELSIVDELLPRASASHLAGATALKVLDATEPLQPPLPQHCQRSDD